MVTEKLTDSGIIRDNGGTAIIPDKKIVAAFRKFEFSEDTLVDLCNFLVKRKKYLSSKSAEDLMLMQQEFDNIYYNTKLAFHMEILSERDFISLIDMLREGV